MLGRAGVDNGAGTTALVLTAPRRSWAGSSRSTVVDHVALGVEHPDPGLRAVLGALGALGSLEEPPHVEPPGADGTGDRMLAASVRLGAERA